MSTIRLTIEYNGGAYCGWQVQANGVSIQALLTSAIEKMVHHPVTLVGSSRTDAGVHALGQVAHFKTRCKIPPNGYLRGINCLLPPDIRIIHVEEAKHDFHAQRDAVGKWYRYLIYRSPHASALLAGRAWHRYRPFDLKAVRSASRALIGQHNFSSFCAADDQNRSKVRRVDKIIWRRQALANATAFYGLHPAGGELIVCDVRGKSFLKQMVRNMVGTLVEVAEGKRDPKTVRQILAGQDRRLAGVCAPPDGLYLVKVRY